MQWMMGQVSQWKTSGSCVTLSSRRARLYRTNPCRVLHPLSPATMRAQPPHWSTRPHPRTHRRPLTHGRPYTMRQSEIAPACDTPLRDPRVRPSDMLDMAGYMQMRARRHAHTHGSTDAHMRGKVPFDRSCCRAAPHPSCLRSGLLCARACTHWHACTHAHDLAVACGTGAQRLARVFRLEKPALLLP